MFCGRRLIQYCIGLYKIIGRPADLAAQGIWHDVNSRTCVDEHSIDWFAVDEAFHIQRLEMPTLFVGCLLKDGSKWGRD